MFRCILVGNTLYICKAIGALFLHHIPRHIFYHYVGGCVIRNPEMGSLLPETVHGVAC